MIQIDNLSFTYPGKTEPTLRNINLSVGRGEFVLITGPTGCGKSTLLKCLSGVIPHNSEGTVIGSVFVDGRDVARTPLSALSRKVGLVQQNPDDQIFSLMVEDEVAFGPENLNLPAGEIDRRIDRALEQVGMAPFREKSVHALSGGQKQRVAIAAILSMSPSLILLDEPASQLDPLGAREVLSVIAGVNAEKNSTIVLVEHRIHEVAHLADRIVVMDDGAVVLDAAREDAFGKHIDIFLKLGLRVPETVELFHRLEIGGAPLTETEAFDALRKRINPAGARGVKPLQNGCEKERPGGDAPALCMRDVWFAYEDENWILKGLDLDIRRGELVALLGNNGSGKSTLLLHMCGVLKPKRGEVNVFGRSIARVRPEQLAGEAGVVFQDPGLMLFCDSVQKEVAFGPGNLKLKRGEIQQRVTNALAAMTIEDLADEPPQALSGGQRLRTAVASVLSLRPRLLLLDEPTSGQDKRNIARFMDYVKALSGRDMTCVFITHDMDTALAYADRVVLMDEGRMIANGAVEGIFRDVDLLGQTALAPPQALTLSTRLGLSPALSVCDLAKTLKSVMAHV